MKARAFTRPARLPVLPSTPEPNRDEVARFLRPQLPQPAPRPAYASSQTGQVAKTLLGARIITRFSG